MTTGLTTSNVRSLAYGSSPGLYTISDASLYLRSTTPPAELPPVQLWQWSRNRRQFVGPSTRYLSAWVRAEMERSRQPRVPTNRLVITFADLIRLRMIVIMRSRGLPTDAIRKAEEVAKTLTRSPDPFLTEELWTNSSDIFLKVADTLVAASKGGQAAMDFLHEHLVPVHHGLTFGRGELAVKWEPMPHVLMDPKIQFGAPCIQGTRIETETIWSFHQAGDSIEALSKMYRISKAEVEAAIEWEKTLVAA